MQLLWHKLWAVCRRVQELYADVFVNVWCIRKGSPGGSNSFFVFSPLAVAANDLKMSLGCGHLSVACAARAVEYDKHNSTWLLHHCGFLRTVLLTCVKNTFLEVVSMVQCFEECAWSSELQAFEEDSRAKSAGSQQRSRSCSELPCSHMTCFYSIPRVLSQSCAC